MQRVLLNVMGDLKRMLENRHHEEVKCAYKNYTLTLKIDQNLIFP